MMWGIPTDFFLDLLVSLLLAATIFYCALLDRRLKALRSGQDGFKATIDQLNTATARAEISIGQLKQATGEAGSGFSDQLERARAVADELSVMVASGNNVAERLVAGDNAGRHAGRAAEASPPVDQKIVSFVSDAVPKTDKPVQEIETGLNQSLLDALKKAR